MNEARVIIDLKGAGGQRTIVRVRPVAVGSGFLALFGAGEPPVPTHWL